MNKLSGIIVVLVACTCFGSAAAYAEAADYLAVLGLEAVKSLHVNSENGAYEVDATVHFTNTGPRGLRLRNGQFRLSFQDKVLVEDENGEKKETEEWVRLGEGAAPDIVLPKGNGPEAPTVIEHKLKLYAGTKDFDTVDRLVRLFNIVGDPANQTTMRMIASAQLWTETRTANGSTGWVYVRDVTVELYFKPSIQRDVAMR